MKNSCPKAFLKEEKRDLRLLWIKGGGHPRVKNRKNLLNDVFRGNFMREIDCAHSRSVKTFEKLTKNSKKLSLKSINVKIWVKIRIFKGETKVFMLRECAQSIFCIKLPLNMSFKKNLEKFFSIFDPGGG